MMYNGVLRQNEVDDEEDVRRMPQPHADPNMRPTNEEIALLKKLHQNLGHPGPKELARSLRLARAKPHLVRYMAKEFRCDVCESRPKPKSARPAVLPKS